MIEGLIRGEPFAWFLLALGFVIAGVIFAEDRRHDGMM